jgi:DNA polymerase (family 10)
MHCCQPDRARQNSIAARFQIECSRHHVHLDNRYVSILGHPTGRLIGEREPYDVDMERIISAARDLGCFLEINAEPDRLDLNDIHAHAAKAMGVKLAVSTDAYSVNALQYMRFGIDQARRGWLTADDVSYRPSAALA